MKCKYEYKEMEFSRALSVGWISSCPDEQETLLFGNFNQMIILNIYVMNDFENNENRKMAVEALYHFERLIGGYPRENIQEIEEYNNLIDNWILNEIDERSNHNSYFEDVFHSICINRDYFTIESFRNHWNKLSVITKNQLICTGCNGQMITSSNTNFLNRISNCMQCRSKSNIHCIDIHCHCRFCSDCAQIVLLFQNLMPNAKYMLKPIGKYNKTKLTALRIETLQRKGLF